jgi:dolichol-phosphate mannosyltransferase
MKKYWQLIKYSLASLSSFALDTGLFYLFKRFVFGGLGAWADLACTVAARAISSFYNFNVNNRLVFGHRGEYGKALGRYYLLAVPLMLASAGFVTLLDRSLGVTAPGLSTAIKIGVDTVLFLASYLIQKKWVFKKKEET